MNWTPEMIRELLHRSNAAVEQAVLAIYARQTSDEQASATTVHSNGRGFSGVDAELLTSFAQWITRSTYPKGRRLTEKQLAVARKRILKYAGQLAEVAADKAAARAPAVCAECAGTGLVERVSGTDYEELPCPRCHGARETADA